MAPQPNKQNCPANLWVCTSSVVDMHITSLKNHLSHGQSEGCPAGFRATFAMLLVFMNLLRELSVSAVGSHMKRGCQSRAVDLMPLHHKMPPHFVHPVHNDRSDVIS